MSEALKSICLIKILSWLNSLFPRDNNALSAPGPCRMSVVTAGNQRNSCRPFPSPSLLLVPSMFLSVALNPKLAGNRESSSEKRRRERRGEEREGSEGCFPDAEEGGRALQFTLPLPLPFRGGGMDLSTRSNVISVFMFDHQFSGLYKVLQSLSYFLHHLLQV